MTGEHDPDCAVFAGGGCSCEAYFQLPDRCPTCGSDDPAKRLYVDGEGRRWTKAPPRNEYPCNNDFHRSDLASDQRWEHPIIRERRENGDCHFCGYFDTPYIIVIPSRLEAGATYEVRGCVECAQLARDDDIEVHDA